MPDVYHYDEETGEVFTLFGSVPIDDTQASEEKVYSSAKVEQLFDGREPYKVLVTAAANQTYAQQLQYIGEHLPENYQDIWMHCALLRGDSGLYHPIGRVAYMGYEVSSDGGFYYMNATINATSSIYTYKGVRFKSDSTIAFVDNSSNTNSTTLSLLVI